MDAGNWLHHINIDRALDRLGTYVDPRKRAALLKFLIEEENQLDAGPDALKHTARRVREGEARIIRVSAIIEGLIDCDLLNEEVFVKAVAVLGTMRESQTLLEQLSERMSS